MAVTGPSATSPAAPAAGTERQAARNAAAPSDPAAPRSAATPAPVDNAIPSGEAAKPAADAAKSAPQPGSAPLSFSYHFDQGTERMIIEARDPFSGFVIYQMPPKYVIKQFTGSIGGIAPTRGTRVDSAV